MLVNYVCKTCQNNIAKLIDDPNKVLGTVPCLDCGGFLERVISGPSSNSVETIDTGFMPKTVEFDAERNSLRKEAADQHYNEHYIKNK